MQTVELSVGFRDNKIELWLPDQTLVSTQGKVQSSLVRNAVLRYRQYPVDTQGALRESGG